MSPPRLLVAAVFEVDGAPLILRGLGLIHRGAFAELAHARGVDAPHVVPHQARLLREFEALGHVRHHPLGPHQIPRHHPRVEAPVWLPAVARLFKVRRGRAEVRHAGLASLVDQPGVLTPLGVAELAGLGEARQGRGAVWSSGGARRGQTRRVGTQRAGGACGCGSCAQVSP